MSKRSFRLAITLTFAGLIVMTIPGKPSAQEDKIKDAAFIAEGEKLFGRSCSAAYCHGAGGLGGGAPAVRDKELDAPYLRKVISDGIPGTAMRAYKSDFTSQQIEQLVAYVMSPSAADKKTDADKNANTETQSLRNPPASRATSPTSASLTLAGDPQSGRKLFFDSAQKSCHACHSFQGEGASIGPDLSSVATQTARELFIKIVMPKDAKDARYQSLALTLKDGERLIGIKKEEDDEAIRLYDTTALPAVLRTIQKSDIARTESLGQSPMPRDYAATYTLKQILDIVAFLKSSDPQSKLPVTLKDLLDAN